MSLYSIREKILYSSFFLSYYNAGGVFYSVKSNNFTLNSKALHVLFR